MVKKITNTEKNSFQIHIKIGTRITQVEEIVTKIPKMCNVLCYDNNVNKNYSCKIGLVKAI